MLLRRLKSHRIIFLIIAALIFFTGVFQAFFKCWRSASISKPVTASSSIGESSVLHYNLANHFVKDGRVFLKEDENTIGFSPAQRAAEGFKFMKTQRIAIAGTARNCRKVLERTKPSLERLARRFAYHKFIFIENDSQDGTREFLLDWGKSDGINIEVLGCEGVNLPKCNLPSASGQHVPGGKYENTDFNKRRHRVSLMAELRNVYLDRISHLSSGEALPFDFLIVIDFDLLATFTPEGMARAFLHFMTGKLPFVDAVCANARGSSLNYFWDACTIVYPPMSKWEPFEQPWEFVLYKSAISNKIPREPGKWRPQKVLSCFQGLTIYRVKSIIKKNIRYTGPPEGYHTCEHNMFAYQMDNVYVEPSLDLHVTMNASE